MLNITNGQLYTFLFSILFGMAVGVIVYLLNLTPKFLKYKSIRIFVQTIFDFIMPIIFIFTIFTVSLIFNYGVVRWFIVVAVSIGCYIACKICVKCKMVICKLNKVKNDV